MKESVIIWDVLALVFVLLSCIGLTTWPWDPKWKNDLKRGAFWLFAFLAILSAMIAVMSA